MKKLHLLGMAMIIALAFASCGSNKQMIKTTPTPDTQPPTTAPAPDPTPAPTPTPTQFEVNVQGVDMVDDLSEDGLSIRKVAYKWYAGTSTANDLQTATEMAEREARATISRIIETAVLDEAERGSVVNNGNVQKAITSHWKQVSTSIQNACEPFGKADVKYDQTTKMYTVTQKVGIRGDRFQKILNNAGNYKPSSLTNDELLQFTEINKSIMNAAKGN